MGAEDDRPQELAHRRAGRDGRRLVVEPGVDRLEARGLEAPSRVLGRREGPRVRPVAADVGDRGANRGDVPVAAALRDEPAARPHDPGEVPEQAVVVRDPVEGRGGQDRVRRSPRPAGAAPSGRRPRSRPVAANGASRARAASTIAGDPSSATTRPAGSRAEQLLGHPAGPAAGVEHRLVAPQREATQDVGAPAGHRVRDAVVRRGVPVARSRSRRVVSHPPPPGARSRSRARRRGPGGRSRWSRRPARAATRTR